MRPRASSVAVALLLAGCALDLDALSAGADAGDAGARRDAATERDAGPGGPDAAGPDDAGSADGGGPNACGGRATLEGEPGTSCGTCGIATWECDPGDTERVRCDEPPCWARVTAGGTHSCGVRGDGTLWCWGNRAGGQLGDGEASGASHVPVQVVAEDVDDAPWSDWVSVTAGQSHTCGLRRDRSAWCWGASSDGRLGGNTDSPRARPARVLSAGPAPFDDWVELSAGWSHTCGVRDDGSLWCWGRGANGRLGDGGTSTRALPTEVVMEGAAPGTSGWRDWESVSAGENHTCARRDGGSLWCWGSQTFGRLGNGLADEDRTTPSRVLAEAGGTAWRDWRSFGAASPYSCGQRADGTLWCWGLSGDQLGNEAAVLNQSRPIVVMASSGSLHWSDWLSVSVGDRHNCGLRDDEGTLRGFCWGVNTSGRLGIGTSTSSARPVEVVPPAEPEAAAAWGETSWVEVVAGFTRTFARRSDGSLWAWGAGANGERGDGLGTTRSTPARVIDPTAD